MATPRIPRNPESPGGATGLRPIVCSSTRILPKAKILEKKTKYLESKDSKLKMVGGNAKNPQEIQLVSAPGCVRLRCSSGLLLPKANAGAGWRPTRRFHIVTLSSTHSVHLGVLRHRMDAGVVCLGLPDKEDGKTSWTIEDDLGGSEYSGGSTCERFSRTVLSEQDEEFLLSGLEEIQGLLLKKEEDEATTLNLLLDEEDPEVKESFQTIGQSNWLYDTLHRDKMKPIATVSEFEGQSGFQSENKRGAGSSPESVQEKKLTANYLHEEEAEIEKCESDVVELQLESETVSQSSYTKLPQYPWMSPALLHILGDSFVKRIQERHPTTTSKLLSDNVGLTKRYTEDEGEDELTNIICGEECEDDLQTRLESTEGVNDLKVEEEPLMTSSILDIENHLIQEEEEKNDNIDPIEDNIEEKEEAGKPHEYSRRFTVQYSHTKEPLPVQPFLDIDNVELTERFRKIVSVFGDKQKNTFLKAPWLPNVSGTDEADSAGEISMEKMMTVIKRLDMEDNWFHYFMNSLPMIGKGSNKAEHEELLAEMQEICPTGSGRITLSRFKIYHAKHLNEARPPVQAEDRRPSWKRISLKWREKKRASDKLLKYFRAIAEAKKMTFTPTRVFFPVLVLLLMGIHIFVSSQESRRSRQFQFALQFDT